MVKRSVKLCCRVRSVKYGENSNHVLKKAVRNKNNYIQKGDGKRLELVGIMYFYLF